MQLEDNVLTVFTATIDERNDTAVIHIPERELDLGTVSTEDTYQVALLEKLNSQGEYAERTPARNRPKNPSHSSKPPVTEGEQLDVEIEDVGDQGDGITRVGPGYIVFVPDTTPGDRVTIEITETREKFGFAEVVTPEPVTG